jgi:hypothetical protein
MRLNAFIVAAVLALSTAPGFLAPGASAQGLDDPLKRLTIAAYFSQACKERAAAIEVPAAADVDLLLAVFARQVAATSRAGAPDLLDNDCTAPTMLLINLLRNNGVDAAFAFVSMLRTTAADSASRHPRSRVWSSTCRRLIGTSILRHQSWDKTRSMQSLLKTPSA